MATGTTTDLASLFSGSRPPDGTKQTCAAAGRKVVRVQWMNALARCSDAVSLAGTTANYPDGESIPAVISDRGGTKEEITTLPTTVKGNSIQAPWTVADVLPIRAGSGGYIPRRELDARADLARTAQPLTIGFIMTFKEIDAPGVPILYKRLEPLVPATPTTPEIPPTETEVEIDARFALKLANYLLTVKGNLKYVRGWAREYVELNDPKPPGGFTLYKKTFHWGIEDKVTFKWTYWNGTAWGPTPTGWIAGQGNHSSASFYNDGTKWVCRESADLTWPTPMPDWPKTVYEGPGNKLETILKKWKDEIEASWSDQFDVRRIGCASSNKQCCRYRVVCEASFTEVAAIAPGVLIVTYENVRSNASLWAGGDERTGLASHEFGHLLGAPDEYPDVFSTQLGQSDGDGLKDGLDPNGIMGTGLKGVKKRHFKGIVTVMGKAVKARYDLDYTYEAVAVGPNLALPPDVRLEPDPGPSPILAEPPDPGSGVNPLAVLGIGAAGAVIGAAIGYLASGGKSGMATGIGAAIGALAGAGIGWMV